METIEQLARHLRDNGYPMVWTSDERTHVAVHDLQVARIASGWRVFETERNQVIATYAETPDESVASRLFLQLVSARIYHLRTYRDAGSVEKLEAALGMAAVPFQRNDVPYEGLLRVFVTGVDLLRAQKVVAGLSA